MNINEVLKSSAELLYKNASESVDVKCEENAFDDEKLSIATSENDSVDGTVSLPNTVIVKNSSGVHIGDRTYLTIQPNIPDREIVEKIVNEVIVSAKRRDVLNVEHLGATSDVTLENLDYVTTDGPIFSPAQNGIKESPKNVPSKFPESNWANGKFSICGHIFNVKLAFVLILGLLALVTGCVFAILKLIADGKLTPSASSSTFVPVTRVPRPVVQANGTSDNPQTPVSSYPSPKEWYLITRKDWNAYEPKKNVVYLHHPVKIVIITHTGGGVCFTEVNCMDKMRGIQAWSVGNRNFDDIPYNFLVGGDGNAFEGLGWDIRGSHTLNYNSVSIGIAFIGNFVYEHPTPQQFEALKRLLAWGVEIGTLDPDYRLVPHNVTHATVSPGRFVYEEIRNWPHFTEDRFHVRS